MDEATLASIHAALAEHGRQIRTLAAANRSLEEEHRALVEKHRALEARCDSLERSVQVLKKDVKWTYLAPDIPHSHWIEQGHEEEYGQCMELLLHFIKEESEAIRNGTEDTCACLNGYSRPTILHDDALLPHFEELADAIQVSSGIRRISIGDIELSPSAINILFPAMEGKVIVVNICGIRFPGPDVAECYESIATSIRRNHTLEHLTWGNPISSEDHADLLIQSAINNRSIKTVWMDNCFHQNGVDGCRALVYLLTCGKPFEEIDFSSNGLSGIDDVAAALATNPQLESLSMTGNELNDRDAELIARALGQNTNLENLYLSRNDLTAAGFERIRTALYDPSNLNAMESCNHTCWVNCVGGNIHDLTPQQRRRRKLYEMLSTRHAKGSNARHLNAETGEGPFVTKFVPRVLERVQQYSDDRSADSPLPLSLLFELMKCWKMPELYEHRRSE